MSLLKVNEVQNFNGSSLTLTASTVSTSAQLNTGGNISVTGSLNVSDDSTTRTNLGLGSIATQDSDNVTVTGGTATLGALTVSGSDSGDLVRITQTGSGNALVVEDSANPDSTPFVVNSSGDVGIGTDSPGGKLQVNNGGTSLFRVTTSAIDGAILNAKITKSSGNADDFKTPGMYRFDPAVTNTPSSSYHHAVVVFGNGDNITTQIAVRIASTVSYVRSFNTSWTSWARLDT